ncbi:uncharacterized protein ACA1_291110 [Acanthamoeba castellanii str. Neff]|uniref:Uncharacterized protein n=1 Tax=Acanthamoeba castellanii (strain ATCC 30010 / Neff) TaxID=1257118 RepID=L8HKX9_ACACF|nr:uncharacterized protein ACA1_291110 [Acanthamoeba castellanii str. Neff]ELR25333.1 hypothetical protein ACA1_291110 [Acanthamoeba castellanii str. Neff]
MAAAGRDDASIEGDPRGSAPEEEGLVIGEPIVVVVPVISPRKREREVGQDGGGTTLSAVVDSSSSGGGGGGVGGEEDEGSKKLERKGSLSRMRHMVEKMVLKRKESREGERRNTHEGSSTTSAPPSPAPAPLVPTLVMTQRSQLLKLQALIDAELASQFPHRTPNDVGAALAELEPHLLRILQRLAQPSPTPASPAPSRSTRVRLAYEYDSSLVSDEPQPQPQPQQPLSKEKVIIINGMTHPEPLWPPPRSSTPSSPLVSVRLHTSEGEEGEAGEPQVLIRRGASRHDGGLLDDDSGSSNHNGDLDNDYDDDDDVSSVADFPARPTSRRRGGEATMRSERRTPKSEGRPRAHSRAEREKPNIIDAGEEVRPLVEVGRPRSHSRVEREKPNIIDVGGGEDQTPASVGRRHRSERGSSKKEQKMVVVVVKEELDDKEKKADHGDDDEDDDLEAWTASQQEGGGKKKEKEKEKKKKRSKSMGSKEEAKDVDKMAANSEEKTPTKMKKRWMTMRKMNSGKVPKAMSDTMVATRDEAEEQQQLQGGSSEVSPPGRKGASGSSSLSGRSKSGPIARASKAKAASPRVVRANSMDTGERRKVAPHAAGGGKDSGGGSGGGGSKGGGGEDSLSSPSKKKIKKEKEKRKKERKKEKEKMKEKDRRSSSEEDQRRIIFNRSQKLDI